MGFGPAFVCTDWLALDSMWVAPTTVIEGHHRISLNQKYVFWSPMDYFWMPPEFCFQIEEVPILPEKFPKMVIHNSGLSVTDLKIIVVWIVMSCTLEKARTEHAICLCWFFAWLTLCAWRRWLYVPSECHAAFELHSIKTKKTMLFIVIAVRTSNPTW
jgi:hypothetical protein